MGDGDPFMAATTATPPLKPIIERGVAVNGRSEFILPTVVIAVLVFAMTFVGGMEVGKDEECERDAAFHASQKRRAAKEAAEEARAATLRASRRRTDVKHVTYDLSREQIANGMRRDNLDMLHMDGVVSISVMSYSPKWAETLHHADLVRASRVWFRSHALLEWDAKYLHWYEAGTEHSLLIPRDAEITLRLCQPAKRKRDPAECGSIRL